MRKQFKDIDIYAGIKAQDGAKWISDNKIEANWKTPEHSSNEIHSLISTSAEYGSASAPGSILTTTASTPVSSHHCLKAPTKVLFPLPAVPMKNKNFN